MKHIDKNGKRIRVGTWVLYPWIWDDFNKVTQLWGRIRCFEQYGHSERMYIQFYDSHFMSSTHLVERLPSNKKEREQILFLRKLEQ
jgi:hypothetical protein